MGRPYLDQQVDVLLPHSVVNVTAQTFFLETGHWGWAPLSQVPGVSVRHRNSSSQQGQVLTGGF